MRQGNESGAGWNRKDWQGNAIRIRGGAVATYLKDDQGRSGGLADGELFVIAGDLNADPERGDSRAGAIGQLLDHSKVQGKIIPRSADGRSATALFGRRRFRVDYVLPSRELTVVGSGVYWPGQDKDGAVSASDHRPVWITVGFTDEQARVK